MSADVTTIVDEPALPPPPPRIGDKRRRSSDVIDVMEPCDGDGLGGIDCDVIMASLLPTPDGTGPAPVGLAACCGCW